jgi:hypothetical protein
MREFDKCHELAETHARRRERSQKSSRRRGH